MQLGLFFVNFILLLFYLRVRLVSACSQNGTLCKSDTDCGQNLRCLQSSRANCIGRCGLCGTKFSLCNDDNDCCGPKEDPTGLGYICLTEIGECVLKSRNGEPCGNGLVCAEGLDCVYGDWSPLGECSKFNTKILEQSKTSNQTKKSVETLGPGRSKSEEETRSFLLRLLQFPESNKAKVDTSVHSDKSGLELINRNNILSASISNLKTFSDQVRGKVGNVESLESPRASPNYATSRILSTLVNGINKEEELRNSTGLLTAAKLIKNLEQNRTNSQELSELATLLLKFERTPGMLNDLVTLLKTLNITVLPSNQWENLISSVVGPKVVIRNESFVITEEKPSNSVTITKHYFPVRRTTIQDEVSTTKDTIDLTDAQIKELKGLIQTLTLTSGHEAEINILNSVLKSLEAKKQH